MTALKDIAAELNLSVSVVSRALNPLPDTHARVSEATRRKVQEAASRLGFRRNRNAEFMKRHRSPAIGVFLPEITDSLIANLIFGISEEAARADFPLCIHTGWNEQRFLDFIKINMERAASGIIAYSAQQYRHPELQHLLTQYCKEGGKLLLLNDCTVADHPVLCMDEQAGGSAAADLLLQSGCSAFRCLCPGLLNGDDKSIRALRWNGFRQRLEQCGRTAAADPDLNATVDFLHRNPGCGIFCTSDAVALQLLRLAWASGLETPRDYKLVGYDNADWTAGLDISSIHQPFREEGRRAAVKLIQMIYGHSEDSELLTPTAMRRGSTPLPHKMK